MQLSGQQYNWKASCLPKLAWDGVEQLGEVHNLTLSKFAAAMAKVRLVSALQQANVRATGPEKLMEKGSCCRTAKRTPSPALPSEVAGMVNTEYLLSCRPKRVGD